MSSLFGSYAQGSSGGAPRFDLGSVKDNEFSKLGDTTRQNADLLAQALGQAAEGFQATRQNEMALRLAKMQQRQRSGGGILESILPTALKIGASFIPGAGPAAVGAGSIVSRAAKSILG